MRATSITAYVLTVLLVLCFCLTQQANAQTPTPTPAEYHVPCDFDDGPGDWYMTGITVQEKVTGNQHSTIEAYKAIWAWIRQWENEPDPGVAILADYVLRKANTQANAVDIMIGIIGRAVIAATNNPTEIDITTTTRPNETPHKGHVDKAVGVQGATSFYITTHEDEPYYGDVAQFYAGEFMALPEQTRNYGDDTTINEAIGVQGAIFYNLKNYSSDSTVTDAKAGNFYIKGQAHGGYNHTHQITNAYGVKSSVTSEADSGLSIDNAYGVHIGDITCGSTNNYGLWVGDAYGGTDDNYSIVAEGDVDLQGDIKDSTGYVTVNDVLDVKVDIRNSSGDVKVNDDLDVTGKIRNSTGNVTVDDPLRVDGWLTVWDSNVYLADMAGNYFAIDPSPGVWVPVFYVDGTYGDTEIGASPSFKVYGQTGHTDSDGWGDFADGIKQNGTTRIDASGNATFQDVTAQDDFFLDSGDHIGFAGTGDPYWQMGRNIMADSGGMLTGNTLQVKVYDNSAQGFQIINHNNDPPLFEVGGTGNAQVRGQLYVPNMLNAPTEFLVYYNTSNGQLSFEPGGGEKCPRCFVKVDGEWTTDTTVLYRAEKLQNKGFFKLKHQDFEGWRFVIAELESESAFIDWLELGVRVTKGTKVTHLTYPIVDCQRAGWNKVLMRPADNKYEKLEQGEHFWVEFQDPYENGFNPDDWDSYTFGIVAEGYYERY